MEKYAIEEITGDNHRPGWPITGYLVRYNFSDESGWTSTRPFSDLDTAETFVKEVLKMPLEKEKPVIIQVVKPRPSGRGYKADT
jgi:hypothetical protein